MKKIAMVAATVGALGLGSIAAPSPAEAHWRGGWGPGIAGGLIAGAVLGGLASSAYAWGPGYGYYDYGPGYYGAGYMADPTPTMRPIDGAAATPRPTTRHRFLMVIGTAAWSGPPTPTTAARIRSCGTAGIITTGETAPFPMPCQAALPTGAA